MQSAHELSARLISEARRLITENHEGQLGGKAWYLRARVVEDAASKAGAVVLELRAPDWFSHTTTPRAVSATAFGLHEESVTDEDLEAVVRGLVEFLLIESPDGELIDKSEALRRWPGGKNGELHCTCLPDCPAECRGSFNAGGAPLEYGCRCKACGELWRDTIDAAWRECGELDGPEFDAEVDRRVRERFSRAA